MLFAGNSAQEAPKTQLQRFFFEFHGRVRGACSHTPLPLTFLRELFANSTGGQPDWHVAETVLDAQGRQVFAGDASRARLSKWLFGNLHNYHHLQQEATTRRLLAVADKLEHLKASGLTVTRWHSRPAPEAPCRSVLHRQYGLSEQRANQPLWLYTSDPDFDGFLGRLWCSPAVARKQGIQHDNKCFLSLPPAGLPDLADARQETPLLDYEAEYKPPPASQTSTTLAEPENSAGHSSQPEQPAATLPPAVAPPPALPTQDLGAALGALTGNLLPLFTALAQASAAAPAAQAANRAPPPAASNNRAPPAQGAAPPPRVPVQQRLGAAGHQPRRRNNTGAGQQDGEHPSVWAPPPSIVADALRCAPASDLSQESREQVIVWGTVSRIAAACLAQALTRTTNNTPHNNNHNNNHNRHHHGRKRRLHEVDDGAAGN